MAPLVPMVALLVCLTVAPVTSRKPQLIRLDEESWRQLLTGEWMVEL